MPMRRIPHSDPVRLPLYLTNFKTLAPAMTGIARTNVNSAAAGLDIPMMMPPMIVAPEREVPGKIAATIWKRPMISACSGVMLLIFVVVGVRPML